MSAYAALGSGLFRVSGWPVIIELFHVERLVRISSRLLTVVQGCLLGFGFRVKRLIRTGQV